MTSKFFDRRRVLRNGGLGLGASAFATACSRPAPYNTKVQSFVQPDFNDPVANAALYAKVAGTQETGMVYLQYYGDIFAVVPNQDQIGLFSVKGIAKSQWTPDQEAQSFSYRNHDHGIFCDYETGEVLETYENPFTGETNIPMHYRSGPLTANIAPKKTDGSDYILPWRVTGNQLSVTESGFGSTKNYLDPKDWPKASTGEKLHFNVSSTYIARTEDAFDPSKKSVVADHIWTFLTPFAPWMLVGDMPGYALWRWVGRKIIDEAELDPEIISGIERFQPNFFQTKEPWSEHVNGWKQYIKERQPIQVLK